jgi:hypothetical protein
MNNNTEQNEKKESNDTSKEKKDASKEDIPIPNTLSIFIKTRIPNHYNITYTPSMTVPESKSHTVYFDPLIKYYKMALTDIPSEAPKNAKVTQFFEANQFDSLINRILSNFLFMQKEKTLSEATKDGYINNNIQKTIDTLFSVNSLLYLDKRPYTIIGRHWTPGYWEIDKKPSNKLMAYFSSDAVKEAEADLNKIPNELHQGNLAAAKIISNNTEAVLVETDSYRDELNKKLADATKEYEELIGLIPEQYEDEVYLSLNNPSINYSNQTINLGLDPVTFSLLINDEQIQNYIKTNKDIEFSEKYLEYIGLKSTLFNLSNELNTQMVNLNKAKKGFDEKSKKLFVVKIKNINLNSEGNESVENYDTPEGLFVNIGDNNDNDININSNAKNEIIHDLEELKQDKIQLFTVCKDTFNMIAEYLTKETEYFSCIVEILNKIRNNYTKFVNNGNKNENISFSELQNICIDSDIDIYKNLITNSDIVRIKERQQLLDNELKVLQKTINFEEQFEKYVKFPDVLEIERRQIDIYINILSLTSRVNNLRIFKAYYESINNSIKGVSTFFTENIEEMETLVSSIRPVLEQKVDYDKYKDDEYQLIFNEYEKLIQLYDIKGSKNDKSITADVLSFFNYVPKKDETIKIVNSKGEIVRFKSTTEKNEFLTYRNIIQLKETLFNLVIIFTHLLQIQCLREYNLHIAERNIIVMDKTILTNQILYYFMIKYHLQQIANEDIHVIPYSVFWEIDNFDTLEKINEKLLLATQTNDIQDSKIKNNDLKLKQFFSNCQLFSRYLTPIISKTGFQKYLTQLLNGFQLSRYISENNLLAFSLFNKEINVDSANFDIQNTVKLNSSFFKDYPLLEQEWIVYNSKNLFDSVASALNGQLDYLNADSVNYYTEPNENGMNRFTINSLLELIKDNGYKVEHKNNPNTNNVSNISDETKNIIKILESVLGITFICFYINTNNQVEILCSNNYNEINDVIYLFIDKNNADEIVKLVRNTSDIDRDGYYIYNFDSVPNQIKELYKTLCIEDKEMVGMNIKQKYLGEFINETTELFNLGFAVLSELNEEELLVWFRKLKEERNIASNQYENIIQRYESIISTEGKDEYEKTHDEIKNLEPDVIYLISKFKEIISMYKKYESAIYDGADEDNEDGGDIIEETKNMIRECEKQIKRLDQIKSGIYRSEYYDYDKIEPILKYFINLYNFVTPETSCDQIRSQANGYIELLQNIERYNNIFHTNGAVLETNKINNLKNLITKVLQQVNIINNSNLSEGIVIQGITDIIEPFVKELFEKIEPFIQVLYEMTTECQDPSSITDKKFQTFLDELVIKNKKGQELKGRERVYDANAKDESSINTSIFGDVFSESSNKKSPVKSPILKRQTSINSDSGISSISGSENESDISDVNSINTSKLSRETSMSGSDSGSDLNDDDELKGGEKTIRTQYEDLQAPYLNQTYPYNQPLINQQQFQPYPNGITPQSNQLYPFGQLINYTHNEQYNIAKEKKSKLSYYIEIELELYPGTEVNTVQRLSVKCQSQFERIREAWADIFGFQYRPALLKEAYAYQASPIKDKSESDVDNKETKGGYPKTNTGNKSVKRQKKIKKNKSIKRK